MHTVDYPRSHGCVDRHTREEIGLSGSLEDVARRAGVSAATVSRALRGLPRVSAATRERVAEAAAELGYVVSPSASRLASGRTGTVGVVVPYVDRWFFGKVIAG